ncbi:hypothetical protein Tco_1136508 [Tanacetum coccineum]
MFDEYLNPPSSVVSPVQEATAARPVDPADSSSSTSIDKDAPSTTSTSQESSSSVKSSHTPLELLVKPKNFKEAMLEPSWIEAIQEEIQEFE